MANYIQYEFMVLSNCCSLDAKGWPQMHLSSNSPNCVYCYADLAQGRTNTLTDTWFLT